MDFKRAKIEDSLAIRELADVIFHTTYKSLISAEQMDYMFEWMYSLDSLKRQMETGHSFFIASKNGVNCGFFSVEKTDEEKHIYHLQKLYLLPTFHGTGMGVELFKAVASYIKSESPKKAVLQLNVNRDNKRAISFYEKNGMIKVKSKDICIAKDFYMNDYIMEIEFETL